MHFVMEIIKNMKKRIINFIRIQGIKTIQILKQRTFNSSSGKIHYIFEKRKGDKLIIVFSGFAGHHQKSRYNYLRSLKSNKNSCLFILDDFGYEKVGSYYCGEGFELYNNCAFEELIQYICNLHGINYTVFCGSSKGGSAALIYGLKMNGDEILAGSPQYRIGDYLYRNDYHKAILRGISNGKYNDKMSVDMLNSLIDDSLKDNNGKTKIKIVYSSLEEDYLDLLELKNTLLSCNMEMEFIDEKYENHSDISKCFPKYLKRLEIDKR